MPDKDTQMDAQKEIKDDKYIRVLMRRSTHKVLARLSKKFDIPNIDLLDNTLTFLDKSGFDPKEIDVSSPAAEVKKLRTTVVSFMRTQEKEILKPMVNKIDGAIAVLVEYLKEANPSLIQTPKSSFNQEPTTDIQSSQSSGKFRLPSSIKSNETVRPEGTVTPLQYEDLKKENFNLIVANEKKDKEIKNLKFLLNSLTSKISPKSFGSGYSIEITKEQLEEFTNI